MVALLLRRLRQLLLPAWSRWYVGWALSSERFSFYVSVLDGGQFCSGGRGSWAGAPQEACDQTSTPPSLLPSSNAGVSNSYSDISSTGSSHHIQGAYQPNVRCGSAHACQIDHTSLRFWSTSSQKHHQAFPILFLVLLSSFPSLLYILFYYYIYHMTYLYIIQLSHQYLSLLKALKDMKNHLSSIKRPKNS